MINSLQLATLALTVLLLPVFAQLYLRSRQPRTLLWLLGFVLAALRMLQAYQLGLGNLSDARQHPWIAGLGQSAALVGSIVFLASFSLLCFPLGRRRIPYAIPFAIPLVLYALLLDGVYHGEVPASLMLLIFPALGATSLLVGCMWAFARGTMPTWIGLLLCISMGGASLWICVSLRDDWPLVFVENALHFSTALLIFYVFRRASAGTLLSGLGFLAWSTRFSLILPFVAARPGLQSFIESTSILGKIITAIGLIMLALEDQLARRQQSEERERRTRKELEAYTSVVLSRRRVEDFDRQASLICQTVASSSRFSQVALMLMQPSGQYRLVGASGIDDAALNALEALVARIVPQRFLSTGTAAAAVEDSHSYHLDLEPWMVPGDDLKRLRLTEVIATPMQGRTTVEGALLLAGMEAEGGPLRADDLLPVEILATRIQSSRSQSMMLEKLVDAEKFAGLGQLANNVTRQLNNPLTVILGYASLLQVTPAMSAQERKGVEAILNEARNMRATLDSLSRMSKAQSDQYSAISVTELLTDMEQLHRSEFVHRSIDFRLHVESSLPRALGNAQQVRQAVLYCLQFAIEAVENIDSPSDRTVRIDASADGESVKIMIAHSGPGFLHPARAFDPFVPAQAAGETAGLGLSLCATILRENNGRISAVNLKPRGAGIVLELQAA